MSIHIFELIENLEIDLANFYSRVKSVVRLRQHVNTFELMESVSRNHAKRVAELENTYNEPKFNKTAVFDMHNKIKEELWDDIVQEKNENIVLEKLAIAEEETGDLYHAISGFYDHMAKYYKGLSQEIEKISNEEYQHRDALLKLQR